MITSTREWFAASPVADDYAKVEAHGPDLAHDAWPDTLATDAPVLVIAVIPEDAACRMRGQSFRSALPCVSSFLQPP